MSGHDSTHDTDETDIEFTRRDYVRGLGIAGLLGAGGIGAVGTAAAAPTASVGSAAYATTVPSGVSAPDDPQYTTGNVSAPYQTNDWWSRLLSKAHAETLFSHPLFTEPTSSGLAVGYTDTWDLGTDGAGVDMSQSGSAAEYTGMAETPYMPIEPDFTVSHTARGSFDESLVDGWGDWHVRYQVGSADPSFTVTQSKGSPFLHLEYAGGGAELAFNSAPTVFEDRTNVLGVSIGGTHYGLFAPSGTAWSGQGTATLSNDLGSAGWCAVAVLPDDTSSTLDEFETYASHAIRDTQVDWNYVERDGNGNVVSEVRTTLSVDIEDLSGSGGTGTITALYPHQHKYLADGESLLSGMTYTCPRGTMKLSKGTSVTTAHTYPGILPHYPIVDSADDSIVSNYADIVSNPDNENSRLGYIGGKATPYGSTYWAGLNQNRWAEAAALVDAYGDTTGRDNVLGRLRGNLEVWFNPTNDDGTLDSNLFFYDDTWGTLVGHIGGFNTYAELNDHHFHYGYFVRGASEVARHNDSWASESNYGGMINMLVREFANPVRGDDMFPFLRNFQPFAGYSLASGINPFHLGNNQEASSEAINAYEGLIRWGAFTGAEIGGHSVEELGIFLYTHEIHAALEYWYDWDQQNHPDDWTREYASVVWDDGYSHSTWWTEDDEDTYAINVIPANGGKTYLGFDQSHTQTVYDELVSLKGSEAFSKWPGILLELQGFAYPSEALSTFTDWESGNYPGAGDYYVPDMSNSKLHTYTLLAALDELGTPTYDVVSDNTFAAVFEETLSDGSTRKNYVAYNPGSGQQLVTFSDGTGVDVPADTLAVQRGANDKGDSGSGGDQTAPSTPTGLSSSNVTTSSVDLSWSASADSGTGVDHYVVSQDGSQVATPANTSVTVTGLSADTTYEFAVAAVDGAGNESTKSSPITVTTDPTSNQSAYQGPHAVPGRVQAENFDQGGEGVAFHDTTTANDGGASYRSTAVDVESATEGGYNICWTDTDEWWEYTVNVDTAGTYELLLRVASDLGGGQFHVEVDGTDRTGSVSFAATGGWQAWSTVSAGSIDLSAGEHVVRIYSEANDWNLNWLEFTSGGDQTGPTAPANLSASNVTSSAVDLSWDAASDSGAGVDHYNVRKDGTKVAETTATSTTVTGLASASQHGFDVVAVDGAGNVSNPSNAVTVTTSVDGQDYTQSASEASSALELSFSPTFAISGVDVTYAVNGGSQSTLSLSDADSDGTWTGAISGLAGGDTVEYYYTFVRNGTAYDTKWFTHDFAGDTTAPSAPTNLASPTQTASTIDLSWDAASDSETGVDHYTVYLDGSAHADVTGTSTTLSGLASGTTYDVYVVAVDGAGNVSPQSGTISPSTDPSSSQSAYNGPHALPGRVQAEDFDSGGSGVAYSDSDAGNNGGLYRTTDVDVGGNGSGGYAVGWTAGGEWYEYTVQIDADGTYDLTTSVASNSGGGEFHVEVDGTDVSGPITVGTTGGWDAWTTKTVSDVSLSAGEHVVRVAVDSAGFDLNWFEFTSTGDTTAPTAPANLTSPAQTATSVDLSWDAASDDVGVDHYNVYEGSTKETEVTGTTATVSGLSASTQYTFTVTAVDAAGNESTESNSVTVTTAASSGDTVSGSDWTATLTERSSSELEFAFDRSPDSNWVDVHYTVNGGSQLNVRMTDQGSYHTAVASGLAAGDTVEYYFTYEENGLAQDTSSYTYTF